MAPFQPTSIGFLAALLVAGCGSQPVAELPELAGHTPLVIDGAASPDELGFDIGRLQRNAVVGQLAEAYGNFYQGCTGTVVGDRVVVVAAHCVVMNQEDWIAGEDPITVTPDKLHYAVGDDVQSPACMLDAEAVHLHSEVNPSFAGIQHDVATIILQQSVLDSCESVVPVQINYEVFGDELVGEQVLQGGFGSVDGTYDFSPIRFWSLTAIITQHEDYLTIKDMDEGFPTFGDSGSGVLYRFADGSLRNLGVVSSGMKTIMDAVRLDNQTALFDEVIEPGFICGSVDELGICRDDVVVTCTEQGFFTQDCRATGEVCGTDDDGAAECGCPCDLESYCEDDCPCDAQCPCECDTTDGCEADCACDPGCAVDPAVAPAPAQPSDEDDGCSMRAGGSRASGAASLWAALALLGAACVRRRRAAG